MPEATPRASAATASARCRMQAHPCDEDEQQQHGSGRAGQKEPAWRAWRRREVTHGLFHTPPRSDARQHSNRGLMQEQDCPRVNTYTLCFLRVSATIRTIAVPAARPADFPLTGRSAPAAGTTQAGSKKENFYAFSLHAATPRRGRQGRIRRRRIQRQRYGTDSGHHGGGEAKPSRRSSSRPAAARASLRKTVTSFT